eukprot:6258201-Pyramimonas_sp.AAC.2
MAAACECTTAACECVAAACECTTAACECVAAACACMTAACVCVWLRCARVRLPHASVWLRRASVRLAACELAHLARLLEERLHLLVVVPLRPLAVGVLHHHAAVHRNAGRSVGRHVSARRHADLSYQESLGKPTVSLSTKPGKRPAVSPSVSRQISRYISGISPSVHKMSQLALTTPCAWTMFI